MSHAETNPPSTPFWRFSLHLYRQPGIADACIALQDGCGVDVNLLLFVMWLAAARQRLSQDSVQKLEDRVRGWRAITIIPIRDMRRALKGHSTLVETDKQEAFRTRIKAVELEAERLQQEALYGLTQSVLLGEASSPHDAVRANVDAYACMLGTNFPKPPLDTLFAAFDGIDHAAFAPDKP